MASDKNLVLENEEGLTGNPLNDPAARLLLDASIHTGEAGGNSLLLIEGGCGILAVHFRTQFKHVINHNIFYPNHKASLAAVSG